MKILIVISALCVASAMGALTEEQIAKLRGHETACIAETGVNPALVANAKKGEIAEGDAKLQCFFACVFKKVGILDAEGQFQESVARAKIPSVIPKDQVDKVINRCKVLAGSTVCETSGKLFKCLSESKYFLLP